MRAPAEYWLVQYHKKVMVVYNMRACAEYWLLSGDEQAGNRVAGSNGPSGDSTTKAVIITTTIIIMSLMSKILQ